MFEGRKQSIAFDVPFALQQKIEAELEPGENLEWIDQPIPRWITGDSIGAILFAIPWTAFALFWMWGASGFKAPNFATPQGLFALFGLPFVLIGLGMLSTPYWNYRRARRTAYALTDRRAVIYQGGLFASKVQTFAPHELKRIYRNEKADGSGDVVFNAKADRDEGEGSVTEVGFMRVRDARLVEQAVRALAEQKQQ